MAKYNLKTVQPPKASNYAGGDAYKQSEPYELLSILLTSFGKDQYYRSNDETVKRLTELIEHAKNPKEVAQCILYARTVAGMRTITHVASAILAHTVKGATWTKDFYSKVCVRPDDMLEICAFYMQTYGKPYPNSLKKGIRIALTKFDGYQLAKYRGDDKKYKLVDMFNYFHPAKTKAQTEAVNALIDTNSLKNKNTWEALVSKAGTEETEEAVALAKTETWKNLLETNKLGYMALLKNLNNIATQSPDSLPLALQQLKNPAAITKSLVLPFRFSTAYDRFMGEEHTMFGGISRSAMQKKIPPQAMQIVAAISDAMELSLANVPKFEGSTVVLLDQSGSMHDKPNMPIKHGSLFAAMLAKVANADVIGFGSEAALIRINPRDSLLTIADKLKKTDKGGTDFHCAINALQKKYDRIIILSDMQAWAGGYDTPEDDYNKYKAAHKANPVLYSWDLQGYGTTQFKGNVICLAGFTDKIFQVMKFAETDKQALIKHITTTIPL